MKTTTANEPDPWKNDFEKPGLLTQALFFISFKIDIIIVSIFLSFLSFLCSANFRWQKAKLRVGNAKTFTENQDS